MISQIGIFWLLCVIRLRAGKRFLHISDLHYDPHYRPSSNPNDECCHRGAGSSGKYGQLASNSISQCDSPQSLLDSAFSFIKNTFPDLEFIIWTGDNARHDLDTKIPRTPQEILTCNKFVMQRYFTPLSSKMIIIPSIGNNDIITSKKNGMVELEIGPNHALENLYSLWKSFVPIPSVYSFLVYGSFVVKVRKNWHVFSLNTLYFWQRNAIEDCNATLSPGSKLLRWMDSEMSKIATSGGKILLTGHVPPLPEHYKEHCLAKYLELVKKYSFAIEGQLFGHLHCDEWFVQQNRTKPFCALFVNSSVRPHYNPSFRIFEYDEAEGKLMDYSQYIFPIQTPNKKLAFWEFEYSFTKAYNVTSLSLEQVQKAYKNVSNQLEYSQKYQKYKKISTQNT